MTGMEQRRVLTALFSLFLLGSNSVQAADTSAPEKNAVTKPSPPTSESAKSSSDAKPAVKATRRALIICGHPGDSDHRKLYVETVNKLYQALTGGMGFSKETTQVVFGDETVPADGVAFESVRPIATKEAIAKAVAELRAGLKSDDNLWVIVLGHAHFDGHKAFFNLPGLDLSQDEFGKLFAELSAKEQVFWMTTSLSGYFAPPLRQKGRVVITATEADFETNETLFPLALADVLSVPPDPSKHDVDGDKSLSIFDLYVAVARDVANRYVEAELLATEHPQLDDNGDGRGSEVQTDFLPPEAGGPEKKPTPAPLAASGDGHLAKRIPWSAGRLSP